MRNVISAKATDEFQRTSRLTLILCLLVLAVMTATAVLVGCSLSHLAETREIAARALAVDGELRDLMNQMLDAETGERGFLLSGRAIYLQPYYDALSQLEKSRVALENALHREPAANGQLALLDKVVVAKLQQLDRAVRLKSEGRSDEAIGLELDESGKKAMDAVRNAMGLLASSEDRRTTEAETEYAREIHNNYWIIAASLALNLLLFTGLAQRMRYAAAQGNVARQETEKHNDELSIFLKAASERNAQVNGLSELSRFLQSCVDMDEAVLLLKQQLPPLLSAESGVLYLLTDARDQLCQVFSWGGEPYAECFEPGDCWAVRLGQPFRQPEQKGAAACRHLQSEHPGIRNDIHCLPLVAHGELMGVLVLDAGVANGKAASLEHEGYRRITIEQVGLSIGNLKLRESLRQQSIRDALTGLYNRRFFEESAQREVLRAVRRQGEGGTEGMTFLMIDIDHFKSFNDEYGHKIGDQVLREVAETLQRHTRGSDVVARYGGEEFTIVLIDTSIESAKKRAETVREDVEKLTLKASGKSLGKITISIGLAQFPTHGSTVAELLLAADNALYQAKGAGRNRVAVAFDASRDLA